jgi:hypothetical protein
MKSTDHAAPTQAQNLTTSIRELLQTCADSATKTLSILSALAENNMLDSFLPFDLEFTSSAASVLIILDDILKIVPVAASVKRRGGKILLEMKQKGSVPAHLRQKEVDRLSRLAKRLWERSSVTPGTGSSHLLLSTNADSPGRLAQQSSNAGSNLDPSRTESSLPRYEDIPIVPLDDFSSSAAPVNTMATTFDTTPSFASVDGDLAEQFDLSQDQMLFVADQLNAEESLFFSSMDFGSSNSVGPGGNWLWGMSGT